MLDIQPHFQPSTSAERDSDMLGPPQSSAAPIQTLDSRRLLLGRSEVLIQHAGQTYRLRHTRNDKLILTK